MEEKLQLKKMMPAHASHYLRENRRVFCAFSLKNPLLQCLDCIIEGSFISKIKSGEL